MAKGSYFEDLEMWKEGMRVCVRVYELMKDCKDFGSETKFKGRLCLFLQI